MSDILENYEHYLSILEELGEQPELTEEEFGALSEEDLQEVSRKTMTSYVNKVASKKGSDSSEVSKRAKGLKMASKKLKSMKEESEMQEETLAASSLHPAARSVSDPQSRLEMINTVMGHLAGMGKEDLTHWFNATMAQFGPGRDYGVGDNSAHNQSTIDMKTGSGPKTADAMPRLGVKEDIEAMFAGQELSEEFKESITTLFEAAVSARVIAEETRLQEAYEAALEEELATLSEEISAKVDSYLNYVVEGWIKENEVAIESTLRNELTSEFIEGLKNLFAEHYINVPEEKVDVLEAMAEKVNALEAKLDETISENTELKYSILEARANEIFEELSADLALTQKDKFSALSEGIEFEGDLDVYARKLMIIKENYFKPEAASYSSNIEEETFEGDVATTTNIDPSINRYVQALARTVKK